ncbi:MAG TPA: hypothetical protein DDW27_08200, partial [Bacteroidales bacterium]|nr:hypothetical protein [Bacteroidales bacterium]
MIQKGTYFRRMGLIMSLLTICLSLFQCKPKSGKAIIIRNDFLEYAVSPDGKNMQFIDRSTGKEYLDKNSDSYCAYIQLEGKQFNAGSVSLSGRKLRIEFEGTDIVATIRIRIQRDRISYKVAGINGNPESLTFLNIPLDLEGMPDEPFSACALSINLFTHVRQIPALQTHLWA